MQKKIFENNCAGKGNRTLSIPAWQAGAPPFMRHPQKLMGEISPIFN